MLAVDTRLARRGFLTLLAATGFAGVAGLPASAAPAWRTYQPEGLGFRVELPAEPEISTEQITGKRYGAITKTIATVEFEDVDIIVVHNEYYEATPTLHDVVGGIRDDLLQARLQIVEDKAITITGVPGRELVLRFTEEGNNVKGIMQFVLAANRLLQFNVFRNQPDDLKLEDHPVAGRFLRSVSLLPPLVR